MPKSFFVKRGDKTRGPFTPDQVVDGIRAKRLDGADLISESSTGPWEIVRSLFPEHFDAPSNKSMTTKALDGTQTTRVESQPTQADGFLGGLIIGLLLHTILILGGIYWLLERTSGTPARIRDRLARWYMLQYDKEIDYFVFHERVPGIDLDAALDEKTGWARLIDFQVTFPDPEGGRGVFDLMWETQDSLRSSDGGMTGERRSEKVKRIKSRRSQ